MSFSALKRLVWCSSLSVKTIGKQSPGLYTSQKRSATMLDARDPDHEKKQKQLTVQHGELFESLAQKRAKNKETFQAALDIYLKRQGVYRRGHVEFMYAAMDKMKMFSVHRDIDTYRKILDLFPKYKMVPQTTWQYEMQHYPKQQQCCIDILDKMEQNGQWLSNRAIILKNFVKPCTVCIVLQVYNFAMS